MLATTVNTDFPGMGIVQSGGKNEFVRFYFSKFSDLEEYYRKRGLDSLGYSPMDKEYNGEDKVMEDLSGEIEFDVNNDSTEYNFEDDKVTIDTSEEQKWGEV